MCWQHSVAGTAKPNLHLSFACPPPPSPLHSSAVDWGYLILLYLFVQLSRAIVVIVLFPGLALSGYGLSWKEAIILVWSGLRGAVALTLALTVSVSDSLGLLIDASDANDYFCCRMICFATS